MLFSCWASFCECLWYSLRRSFCLHSNCVSFPLILQWVGELGAVLKAMRESLTSVEATGSAEERFDTVLKAAKTRFGSMLFSYADYVALYNFGLRVPAALVTAMTQLHFSIIPFGRPESEMR